MVYASVTTEDGSIPYVRVSFKWRLTMKTKGQRKAEDRRQYRRREKARDVAEITRETMLGRVVRRGHAVGRGCPT